MAVTRVRTPIRPAPARTITPVRRDRSGDPTGGRVPGWPTDERDVPLSVNPARAEYGRRALNSRDPSDRLREVLGDLMHMAAADGIDFTEALEVASQRFVEEAGGEYRGASHGIIITFDEGRDADAFNNVFCYTAINVVLVGGASFDCERQAFAYDDDNQFVMRYMAWDDDLRRGVGPVRSVPVADIVAIHIR
jgi:hypothetical protein